MDNMTLADLMDTDPGIRALVEYLTWEDVCIAGKSVLAHATGEPVNEYGMCPTALEVARITDSDTRTGDVITVEERFAWNLTARIPATPDNRGWFTDRLVEAVSARQAEPVGVGGDSPITVDNGLVMIIPPRVNREPKVGQWRTDVLITTDLRGSRGYAELVASRLAYRLTQRGYEVEAPFRYGVGKSALDGAIQAGGTPVGHVGYVAGGGGVGELPPGLAGTRCTLIMFGDPPGVPANRGDHARRLSEEMVDAVDVVIVVGSSPPDAAGVRDPSLDGSVAEARGVPVIRVPIPWGTWDSRTLGATVDAQVTATVAGIETVLGHPHHLGVEPSDYPWTPGDRLDHTQGTTTPPTTPPLGVPVYTNPTIA